MNESGVLVTAERQPQVIPDAARREASSVICERLECGQESPLRSGGHHVKERSTTSTLTNVPSSFARNGMPSLSRSFAAKSVMRIPTSGTRANVIKTLSLSNSNRVRRRHVNWIEEVFQDETVQRSNPAERPESRNTGTRTSSDSADKPNLGVRVLRESRLRFTRRNGCIASRLQGWATGNNSATDRGSRQSIACCNNLGREAIE